MLPLCGVIKIINIVRLKLGDNQHQRSSSRTKPKTDEEQKQKETDDEINAPEEDVRKRHEDVGGLLLLQWLPCRRRDIG